MVLSSTAFSVASVVATASSSPSPSTNLDTIWSHVPQGPPDAILGIAQAFRAAPEEYKVNVCVGAYRDAAFP